MKNKNGFTIIETIIFIIIASMGFLVLSASYTSVLEENAKGEYLSVATALCEGKMEEVTATYSFDTIPNVPKTVFDPPFGSYSYQVNWFYVDPGNLKLNQATSTDYKVVMVTVDHDCIEPIQLTTLLANY